MAKLCNQCSNLLYDDEAICTRCGAVQKGNEAKQNYIAAPEFNRSEYPQPVYEEELSTFHWLGIIVLTNLLSVISIVITMVWAFKKSTRTDLQKYCRGLLLYQLLLYILVPVLAAIGMAIGIIPTDYFSSYFSQ